MTHLNKFLQELSFKSKQAAVVTKPENIEFLTGFKESIPSEMFGFVLCYGDQVFLVCDARYTGNAQALASKNVRVLEYPKDQLILKKLAPAKCEYEDSITVAKLRFLKKVLPSFTWKQKIGGFDAMRRIKTKEEIMLISRAQDRVDEALIPFFSANLRAGVSEIELQRKLDRVLSHDFEDEMSFPTQVSFSENSAIPHHHSGSRKLELGDNILIDCGVRVEGYCSDVTRNYVFGSPDQRYLGKYKFLLDIQQQILPLFKAGVKGAYIDQKCRDLMGPDADFYTHSLGHGVGLEIHELPRISYKSKDQLRLREVVTCEPGIYYPGTFGIRIEDLVVVGEKGPEILSKITKDLLSFDEQGGVTTMYKA